MSPLRAFALSFAQLGDPALLKTLAKAAALTLAIFAAIAAILWLALGWALAVTGYALDRGLLAALSALIAILLGWFLFRAVAMAVLGMLADDVVEAVERRHYPDRAAAARPVPFAKGVALGLHSAGRTIGYNMLALPLYAVLVATGIGTLIAVLGVNALLLGRDLAEMVTARHPALALPSRGRRTWLGLPIAALFMVPVVNLLAPVLGAAMAVHMIHGRKSVAAA
jgi:CysZ protein